MAEQLYNQFSDLAALEAEKQKILAIFEEIKNGIIDLSKLGFKLDSANNLKELQKALDEVAAKEKELNRLNNILAESQKKLAAAQAAAAAAAAQVNTEAGKQSATFNELSNDLKSNIQRQVELKNRLQEVAAAIKQLNQFKGAAQNSAQFNDEVIRLTTEQAQLKQELRDVNKLIGNQVREFQAAEGSIDEMRAKLNQLNQAFDSLQEGDRESQLGKDLLKQIKELDAELKKLEGSTGRFQRNVGNYAGSLAGAFDTVTEEIKKLTAAREKLIQDFQNRERAGFVIDPKEIQRLNQTTAAIQQLEQAQQVGFKTTGNFAQQVRNLENAYINLTTSGTQSTEFLNEFRDAIGIVKDDVNDLRQSIKLAASDTRTLDVFIGAGQAIAGSFGVAQGSAALFGQENEDLQRTLVKLNGVMTILNGLQAIQNELKKKDNILTLAQIQYQKLYAFVVGNSTGVLKLFRIALAATGVGLLIIGITTLVEKLGEFINRTSEATKAQKKLNDEIENTVDLAEGLAGAIDKAGQITVKRLEAQGASEEKINQKRIKFLREQVDELGKAKELADQQFQILADQVDAAKEAPDALRQEYHRAYDTANKAGERFYDAQHQLELALLDDIINRRKKQDELTKQEAKSLLELYVFRQQLIADQNKLNASDDSFLSTKERIQAATKEVEALKNIIIAQRNFELSQDGLTSSGRILIREKASREISKIESDLQTKLIQIQINSIEKRLQAEKDSIDDFIDVQQEKLKASTEASQRLFEKEQLLAAKNRDEELKNAAELFTKGALTREQLNAERLRIEEKYQRSILLSQIEFFQKQIEILKSAGANTLEAEANLAKAKAELKQIEVDAAQKAADAIKEIEEQSAEERKQRVRTLATEVTNAFTSVVSGVYDNQKNRIQDQIDQIEKLKAAEIERINLSTDSEEKKAARIKIIESKAAADREALERRQRQIDRQKALFERAASAFTISVGGIRDIARLRSSAALAFANALATIPPPGNIGIATALQASILSQIPFVLGTTAAQLVQLLATPIPKFWTGTENAPKGFAIWGEKGTEMKVDKNKNVEFSPNKASLTYLSGGEKIYPADVTKDILNAVALQQMAAVKHYDDYPATQNNINEQLVKQYTKKIVEAIEEKPVHVINIHNDATFHAYIEAQVKR